MCYQDVYVLAGVSYLSGKTALFAFISIWKEEDSADDIDFFLLIGLGIGQGLWQTLYVLFFYITVSFSISKHAQFAEQPN